VLTSYSPIPSIPVPLHHLALNLNIFVKEQGEQMRVEDELRSREEHWNWRQRRRKAKTGIGECRPFQSITVERTMSRALLAFRDEYDLWPVWKGEHGSWRLGSQ